MPYRKCCGYHRKTKTRLLNGLLVVGQRQVLACQRKSKNAGRQWCLTQTGKLPSIGLYFAVVGARPAVDVDRIAVAREAHAAKRVVVGRARGGVEVSFQQHSPLPHSIWSKSVFHDTPPILTTF